MSNNLKFLIGFIIVTFIIVVASSVVKKEDNIAKEVNEAGQNSTIPNPTNPTTGEKVPEISNDTGFAPVGSYEVYSPEKIAEKSKTSRVVLFFNAVWCPTCRALDNSIKVSTKQIPGDVTILSVDYDTYTELKKKYGVTYQHTLVQVDAEGNMIKKWSGSSTLSALVQQVK